jgi:hypothetical protein
MSKQETITPKHNPPEPKDKLGSKEIRSAYFKNWYDSCKDIYNKERRKKRKEKRKKRGIDNG